MDCSPPGFSVRRILQARILEWAAISFSRRSFPPRNQIWVSCTAGIRCNTELWRNPMIMSKSESHSVVSDSLWPHGLYSLDWILQARILEWVAFPFSRGSSQPTQGSNSGLLHCRLILYQLSHKGSPIILEWVACPFSSGSSQPRVSCIAGRFFTNWVSYSLPNFTNLQCNPWQAIQFYCKKTLKNS